jgi:hypothetical protein
LVYQTEPRYKHGVRKQRVKYIGRLYKIIKFCFDPHKKSGMFWFL